MLVTMLCLLELMFPALHERVATFELSSWTRLIMTARKFRSHLLAHQHQLRRRFVVSTCLLHELFVPEISSSAVHETRLRGR